MQTRILGNFTPSQFNKAVITREIIAFVESHGLVVQSKNIDVRSPRDIKGLLRRNDDVVEWHHDGEASGGVFAIWSNKFPTEIDPPVGNSDGDVVLIYNSEVRHRMPQEYEGRWFARCQRLEEKWAKK